MDEKKKYVIPDAEISIFTNEDIVTSSGEDLFDDDGTNNQETW